MIGPVSIGVCASVVLVAIGAHHLVEKPAYLFITKRFLPRAPTSNLCLQMGVPKRP